LLSLISGTDTRYWDARYGYRNVNGSRMEVLNLE